MINRSGSVLKSNTVKVVSAVVAVGAVVAMGTLTVRVGAVQAAQDPAAVPQHFGGPVNTSIFAPTASLGMPMTSASNPQPTSAPGDGAPTPAAS
jgi:hypothetical protein